MDEFKAQDVAGSLPAAKRRPPLGARLLCYSTNQLLYQGAATAGETRPEESLAKVERKVAGSIPERSVRLPSSSRDNDCFTICLF